MQFTPDFIDMDGGLTHGYLSMAVIFATIAFGAWMILTLRSRRPPLAKAIQIALIYLLSIVGTQACLITARLLIASSQPQGVQVGYIGDIPLLAGPTAALILAAVLYIISLRWGRPDRMG
jgi:hypothetical protein